MFVIVWSVYIREMQVMAKGFNDKGPFIHVELN